jgi:hypothetical protein
LSSNSDSNSRGENRRTEEANESIVIDIVARLFGG